MNLSLTLSWGKNIILQEISSYCLVSDGIRVKMPESTWLALSLDASVDYMVINLQQTKKSLIVVEFYDIEEYDVLYTYKEKPIYNALQKIYMNIEVISPVTLEP